MLGAIDEFRRAFADHATELVCPRVVQTLSVDELVKLVPDMDGWIAGDDPVNREVLAAGKRGRLRAVVKWGVGVDNVDFGAASDIGVPVKNTPGMFGNEVADVAVSYVTALARETFGIDRGVRRGEWPKPRGISLAGRTVGLVGFGDIGRSVARRLLAAGMRVLAYDPAYRTHSELVSVESAPWPERIGEADFLVFTCALTKQNRHMLDATVFEHAKRGVRVVNVARGPLIDEAALAEALASGKVHSAALDVFEEEPLPAPSPLRAFDRCIFGSHNGSNTEDAVRRTSARAIELLYEMLAPAAVR
jgi:D-3-phosphoglycerate dehydrogenase